MSLRYRPLAIAGFTVLVVLFLSIFIDRRFALVSIACGTVVLILSVFIKKIRNEVFPFFIAASLFLGGMLFTLENDYGLEEAQKYISDDSVSVTGTVSDFPSCSNSRYYYVIKADSINGKPVDAGIRLSLPEEIDAEPYDRISTEVKLYEIGSSGGEETEQYFHSKGIYLGAYENADSSVSVFRTEKKPFMYQILRLRNAIEDRILEKLPDESGGTAVALLLGDKSFISDETLDKIYEAGIAPVFAVSGLHLSIWVLGLYDVLKQLKVRKQINSAICIVFTLFFMALTGFTPSVCRSGLMMLMLLSGNLFYLKSDSLNSLGFAALVLCIINPFIASDIGFLLSFSATLGIILINTAIEKKLLSEIVNRPLRALVSAVSVSVSATLGALPVTVIFIEYISVFSVISNLLVTYAAGICMILSGFTAILFRIRILSDITSFLAGLIAKYILWVIETVNSFSVTTISTSDIFWKGGIVLCLAAFVFSFLFFKGKKSVKICSAMLSVIIISVSLCSVLYYDGLTRLEILNVGDGICITAANGNRKVLLCDEADGYNAYYAVEDSLDSISRRKTNLLLIPNDDSANCDLTFQLLKEKEFVKVVTPSFNQSLKQLAGDSLVCVTDSVLNVWDGGKIEFHCDENDSYAYCDFDGTTFFIIFSSKRHSEYDSRFKSADYLVCDSYIPDSLDPSGYGTVMLSTVIKKAEPMKEYVSEYGGRAILTCSAGNISVRIRESDSKIYIKSK